MIDVSQIFPPLVLGLTLVHPAEVPHEAVVLLRVLFHVLRLLLRPAERGMLHINDILHARGGQPLGVHGR